MARFEPVTEEAFETSHLRLVSPRAVGARYDRRRGRIVIDLSNGLEIAFLPKDAEGLENAAPEDLAGVQVGGAGGALHFPALDADFSIPRLMEGFLGSNAWTRRMARAEASRRNGKRGGRPRKAAAG